MNVQSITHFSQIKGLNVVGTGDFTHPKWLSELKGSLTEDPDTGLYAPTVNPESNVRFIITGEVCTIFDFEGKTRKIHHVIWTPNIEIAEQINDSLSKYGSLSSDGRPTLNMSAPFLVDQIMNISEENFIFPAHAWTPWFSIFGAFGGFDRLEDCYQDMSSKIFALETGLSSDPPMNWRLSALDRYTLLSNSDSHSAWPWRLGREANVFELNKVTYWEIVDAIKKKDTRRFLFTIETDPAYGKYHWTGHRTCSVSMSPSEAIKNQNKCPVCGRRLTKGVEQRVEELADRPVGFIPKNTPGYVHLLPLSEIISSVIGSDNLSSQKVWKIYNTLINKFGNEYNVLLKASLKDIAEVVESKIADLIVRVREDKVKVIPGYDGVYGKLVVSEEKGKAVAIKTERFKANDTSKKASLEDFM
jgi:uncharacterized protein (TIGR00375 family)